MKKETVSVHSGTWADKETGGVNTPIFTSSAFDYTDREQVPYPRYSNTPNQDVVARKIADLENGEAGLVFSSGMAAMSTSILAFAGSGDHVVLIEALYGGTHSLATRWFNHFGISYTFTDTDAEDVVTHFRPDTKVVVIESPTNPLLQVLDIRKVAEAAKAAGIITVIDNTFATPVNQTPLDLGIDIVVHSGTKYMGGHSDFCCGMAVSTKAHIDRLLHLSHALGPSLDARVCSLLERSMKTLVVRVERQTANAGEVARWLAADKRISKVYYPGLETAQGYNIARVQMKGFGGMLSFELAGKDSHRFVKALELIRPAVSLGGVESTICSPALTSHAKMSRDERESVGVRDSLLRLSVGIEAADDIMADMEQAMTVA